MDRHHVHDRRLDPVHSLRADAAGTVSIRFVARPAGAAHSSPFSAILILARLDDGRHFSRFHAGPRFLPRRGLQYRLDHDGDRIRLGRLRLWGAHAIAFFFIIMFVGGCAGSTSCGIKIFRFQVFFEAVRQHIAQVMYPHGVFRASGSTASRSRTVSPR
jgi:hypothetical protein